MNITNIPPKNTRKRIYENQNLSIEIPISKLIVNVWINKKNPIARGCFNWIKIIEEIIRNMFKENCIIKSENSLI